MYLHRKATSLFSTQEIYNMYRLEFKIYLIYNMRNQVIIDKMGLSAFMYLCTFGHNSDGFLSCDEDFIFHKTCCIFYINLSIINNNITQYNVVKSDSTVDESKVQKKDRLLAITFNGTDACKVPELLFQHIYIEEHISGIQESEFQEGKKIGNLMAGYF